MTVPAQTSVDSPHVSASPESTFRAASPRARLLDWLRLARPRQWPKNLLVAAAPLAAGRWLGLDTIADTAIAFGLFTLVAAGCYMVNDSRDADRDRWHATKRHRPIAAGRIRRTTAERVGAACSIAGVLLALLAGAPWLAVTLAAYVTISLGYSWKLKHIPAVEIAALGLGFVLRPLAGAAATGIAPSRWFLIVTCAGAVLVATGKRLTELSTAGAADNHRPCLRSYTVRGLGLTQLLAITVLLAAYIGWVLTRASSELPFAFLSLAALTAVIGRYLLRSRRGEAGAPEELLLHDRLLLASAAVWLLAMLIGSLRA